MAILLSLVMVKLISKWVKLEYCETSLKLLYSCIMVIVLALVMRATYDIPGHSSELESFIEASV